MNKTYKEHGMHAEPSHNKRLTLRRLIGGSGLRMARSVKRRPVFTIWQGSLIKLSRKRLNSVYMVRVTVSAIPFSPIPSGGSPACSLPEILKNACILRDSRLKSSFVCHGNKCGQM